jgi:hypothetical protein
MLYLVDDELMIAFLEESDILLSGMSATLNQFVEGKETSIFEDFAQQIDRIMGTAYTLSLSSVGDLCKLGKELGYKASQISETSKLIAIQSLLNQLTKVIRDLLKYIAKGESPDFTNAQRLAIKLEKAIFNLGNLRVTVEK